MSEFIEQGTFVTVTIEGVDYSAEVTGFNGNKMVLEVPVAAFDFEVEA